MILDKIIEDKRKRLNYLFDKNNFKSTLKNNGFTIIGEFKKASPSKGIIVEDFNVYDILKVYEELPIGIYSVLTEEDSFLGSNENLINISKKTNRPLLRKDFIIDPYQIYEAKAIGAEGVLLIVAVLGEQLGEYINLAKSVGLELLVEVHDEEELEIALRAEAEIIGINNRNLKTFEVSLKTTEELIKKIPKDKIVISESGISTLEEIKYLKSLGVKAVLVGETFMRNINNEEFLKEITSVVNGD